MKKVFLYNNTIRVLCISTRSAHWIHNNVSGCVFVESASNNFCNNCGQVHCRLALRPFTWNYGNIASNEAENNPSDFQKCKCSIFGRTAAAEFPTFCRLTSGSCNYCVACGERAEILRFVFRSSLQLRWISTVSFILALEYKSKRRLWETIE